MEPNKLVEKLESGTSAFHLLSYIDAFVSGLGVGKVEIDVSLFDAVLTRVRSAKSETTPDQYFHAASFVIAFIQEAPLKTPFTQDAVGDICRVKNHQNIVVALSIAFDSLDFDSDNLSGGLYIKLIESLTEPSKEYIQLLSVTFEAICSADANSHISAHAEK